MRNNDIRILLIKGGGMKGVLPSMMLREIVKVAGKPIAELFDYISVTSSASFTALEYIFTDDDGNIKYSPDDIFQTATEDINSIFPQNFLNLFLNSFGMFSAKYNTSGIDGMLSKKFGDAKLADTHIPISAHAFSLSNHMPKTFSTFKSCINSEENISLKDFVEATSAAPIFFEPKEIAGEYYVDGGLYANSPAIEAFVDLKTHYPELTEDNLIVVSLGTGKVPHTNQYSKGSHGLFQWLVSKNNIIKVLMEASQSSIDYAASKIFKNYYELEPVLTNDQNEMDKPSNIPVLLKLGEEYIAQNQDKIKSIVAALEGPSHRLKYDCPNAKKYIDLEEYNNSSRFNTLEPHIDDITIITETDSAYWSSYAYSAAKYSAAALLGMTAGVGLSAYVAMSSAEALAEIFMTVTDNSVFCH